MSIWGAIKDAWNSPVMTGERRTMTLAELDAAMSVSLNGVSTAAGINVAPERALQSVAVFACVAVLADTISTLPLPVYQRLSDGGKRRATEHYLYPLLHDSPNPEMTAAEYWDCVIGHKALWGNHYSEIKRRPYDRQVEALWPLRPDRMELKRDKETSLLIYEYRLSDGEIKQFAPWQILHFRRRSDTGLIGYSPIREAREAIGLTLATEQFGSSFFGNGSRPGGVLEVPKGLSDTAYNRLKKDWESGHKGLDNAQRVGILEEGMTWKQIGIPPDDAQFLETRKFQINEIARLFRIPPHMIGDLDRATFSNIEQQSIEFVVHTIRPWLVRVEQRIKQSLFTETERLSFFPEFLVDGLLRGDIKARYEAYAVGRNNGWLSANDIRELENMNPLPGDEGSIYLVPLNMVPASQIGQMGQEPAGEEPTPAGARALAPGHEERSASHRKRIRDSYKRLFREAIGRVVRREAGEVKRAIEKYSTQRSLADLVLWLEDYYRRSQPDLVRQNLQPILASLAEVIDEAAASEIGAQPEMGPALENLSRQIADDYAAEYASRSLGQLTAIIRENDGDEAAMQDALNQRLDEWKEKRADKLALIFAVGASSAFAIHTWRRGGRTKLRSIASGENCPFCSALNGKIIGINDYFLSKGDSFQPDGAAAPLVPKRNMKHPPYHSTCDCTLVSEA